MLRPLCGEKEKSTSKVVGKWGNREFFGLSSVDKVAQVNFERVPYAALTKAFSLIEATTKRLEKTAILTSFLLLVIQRSSKADHNSLLQAVYLCINRVRCTSSVAIPHLTRLQLSPDYVGVELGIGESLLVKAIAESTGRSLSLIKADLKREGDLGLVAMVSLEVISSKHR